MGTKIKIQKGFVKPPVKYNKEINCKRSNNKQIVISLKLRALVIGNFRVKKMFNNNNKTIKDMVANRLKSTSIIKKEKKTAND